MKRYDQSQLKHEQANEHSREVADDAISQNPAAAAKKERGCWALTQTAAAMESMRDLEYKDHINVIKKGSY